jgi:hypothetical protein
MSTRPISARQGAAGLREAYRTFVYKQRVDIVAAIQMMVERKGTHEEDGTDV